MIGATSFLNHSGPRPPRYRTPSPPRRAVEPISPFTTTDFRASWIDRGASQAASSDRDRVTLNNDVYSSTNRGSHGRTSHGRSSSTIDTLATIALATSPTFAPLSYRPPSQDSTPAMSLFPSQSIESTERPAKRPRSEKSPSPLHQPQTSVAPDANPSSTFDSMKTDAELLLNFARPSNFHPAAFYPSKRVSIDESYHPHYGEEPKSHFRAGLGSTYILPDDEKSAYHTSANTAFPASRMRSQSDGSAFISRPVIQGVRPNTSSSTLPPIVWQEEEGNAKMGSGTPGTKFPGAEARYESSVFTGIDTGADRASLDVPPRGDDETESDENNQANCAACNLVRIPVDSEEQGDVTWISCDGCKQWFHIVCAGFKNDREIRTVDKFICRRCRPIHGQTTFVRKSSRTRTAIDYAGLNQGLVKAASDSLEHHYIEPIREGKIRFLPENFPRMRPELVTAEYFERGSGMTEPIVIPAHLNTRDSIPIVDPEFDALVQEATSQEMFDELLEHVPEEGKDFETVVDCGQDQLDMVVPQGLTVRTVAELYGPEERVEVIDVKSQQGEDKRWNMQKWADYYESTGSKVVRNVISLEVSQSKLGRLIRRPKIVRDLDLQDAVWPEELKAIGDYPKVQFYCLMSVADCYTDFHIDFGGSSVYYHILKGKKTFFFIPPKDKHLKKYEDWCNSPAQDSTFLGDQTKECYRVDLSEGDTMLIPSGWIHAVWTPTNSLVIGGNFLTRLNYGMQIKVAKIEKDTKVPRKFRYPFFQRIQWYTALKYLEDDPIPQSVLDAFAEDENYRFHRAYPIYYEFGERENKAPAGDPYHNSRFYSQAELEGLPDLAKYLLRTALIASGYMVEGVTMDARNAVKRSIPKGQGDPVDTVRKFGIWVAWKRGNEKAPQWTRPGVVESNAKLSLTEKKPAGRPSRRSERNAEGQRMYAERQAVQRPLEQPPDLTNGLSSEESSSAPSTVEIPQPTVISTLPGTETNELKEEMVQKPRSIHRSSGLGPKRVACDACRKRRIRCRHKDEHNDTISAKQTTFGSFPAGVQSSLAHDAASALNSLAAIASEAGFQDAANGYGLDRLEGSGNYSTAILSTPNAATSKVNDGSPEGLSTGKKGRSKACDDCRKSKRRCIHDEYGRIDPIKAQERSKPRAAASAKRPKQESTSPVARPASLFRAEGDMSHTQRPVDLEASSYFGTSHDHNGIAQTNLTSAERKTHVGQTSYASPPAFQSDTVVMEVDGAAVSKPTASLVSPPTSQADETDVPPEQDGEKDNHVVYYTPTASSRHSSRQPRHVDRYVPESQPAKAVKTTHTPSTRRASFSGPTTARRVTPGVQESSKKSASRPSSSHAKKGVSPATEKKFDRMTTTSTSPGHKGAKRERTAIADDEPDAESLRLIRELQEQEFGLRKRTTRV
ncbi:[Histone H3]-lysine-36 demethylase [Aspergillus fischeri NRRL 181]|uniref:JmjC domain-containing histone demethylation protein 1 n=1 Tax=Neosartorya fischeri (strain ATCC 1020 / DSM 3700 / CBS 544.65 / FGSC A1164 / JCM 1740 / NRRL 181 / WB 181) TaxID=331117 RepID=A1DG14_NEOFI|nr:PHD finger and JmjC domain protein, putative [Aspergillus fischeri NRRL 181]EAW18321.1 PHD finger and JmjC domain protein, putative [Aspergillus fischeri NRRL 181]KAG2024960.1 hypothetical protein GB937_003183 [Aspergillus fischeri]